MEVLANLIVFVLYFNFLSVVYSINAHGVAWGFLALAVPFFAMYLLRRRVRRMSVLIVSHFVLVALPLLLVRDVAHAFMVIGFMAVAALYSIIAAIKGERRFQLVQVICVVVLIAVAHIAANTMAYNGNYQVYRLDMFTRVSILLVIAAGIVYVQMDNLHANLRIFGTSGEADSNVYKNNNKVVSGFSAALVAIVTVGMLFGPFMAIFMRFLGQIAYIMMQIRIFFIPNQPSPVDVEGIPTIRDAHAAALYDGHNADASTIDSPWILGAAVLGAFAIILIAIAIGRALARKRQRIDDRDIADTNDEMAQMKFSARDLAMFLPRRKGSIKHPLRRAYIKKVRGHIKQGTKIKRSHTPEVIANLIREREDIDVLTAAYEAVRYSARE